MPEAYPQFSPAELEKLRGQGYQELAFEILSRFADDIPEENLRDIIGRTYTVEKFQSEEITPLKTLEPGVYILGLSNGRHWHSRILHCNCWGTCLNTR